MSDQTTRPRLPTGKDSILKLSDQQIVIHAPRELCFEVVASAGKLVERRSETERVVEFTTAHGASEVRTVELLLLEKPNVIRYEWLEGPLDDVREVIFFDELDERTTHVRYEGQFSFRSGIAGAVIGRIKVRPIFDRLVREHLAEAKSIAERRASRSRVYPTPARAAGTGPHEKERVVAIDKVTSETFREHVLNSDVPVVVDFYADWCGPCHQIAPILNTLSVEHEGLVRFTKVNVDEEPELARAYRISTIPAVLMFDSGAPTAWSIGPKPGYLLEKELSIPRVVKRSRKGKNRSWWRIR